MADLYTFTLSGGAAHRCSASDEPVAVGERQFALGMVFSRGTTRIGPGIAVDELEFTVSASDAVRINGMPMLRFITGGGLDGGRLVLERAFSAGPWSPGWGRWRSSAGASLPARCGATAGSRSAPSCPGPSP
jgi:hypothetical protein